MASPSAPEVRDAGKPNAAIYQHQLHVTGADREGSSDAAVPLDSLESSAPPHGASAAVPDDVIHNCEHRLSQRCKGPSSIRQRCKKCAAESSRRWRSRHPWKTIWLGFVRRAYRKFGKNELTAMDLRWRVTGVHSLAAAINRATEAGAAACTADCLARADKDATLNENRSRASDALLPQLEGCHWVLTWPKDMVALNVQQLVLLKREEALHRSRNSHPRSPSDTQDGSAGATAAAH